MIPLRIFSWNILHGGGSRCEQILRVIENSDADIVALQEFRHGKSKTLIIDGLVEMGLNTCYSPAPASARENSLLVATRLPMEAERFPASGSGKIHAVKCTVEVSPDISLNMIAVHFPQKKAQIPLFGDLLDLPADWLTGNSLLIGDFNCGIPLQDSDTKTFYATHLFQQLLQNGWCDLWRSRHPNAREFTWISTRKSNGFRYDHALGSACFDERVLSVEYDHDVREKKYSDHSSLLLTVEC